MVTLACASAVNQVCWLVDKLCAGCAQAVDKCRKRLWTECFSAAQVLVREGNHHRAGVVDGRLGLYVHIWCFTFIV